MENRTTITKSYILMLGLILAMAGFTYGQEITALDVITRSNQLMRGESSYSEITMQIIRPKWDRTVSLKVWSKGNDYSLLYITAPAKEKGQVFLKRNKEMWNWVPSIERMIKIPPSMMMQSWMGSDFTNDDLVKESSIVDDYSHTLLGSEKLDGYDCFMIELVPDEDAPVVWGKIISWVSKEGYIPLKNEYYDEDEYLVNTEHMTDIKDVGDRVMPTRFELIPAEKEGNKTVMVFDNIRFNIAIENDFFSIQNMKRIR
jgi:outer membrane lipoprotein-sorting protein